MNEPDWSLYRSFLSVLESGSASGAARALGLTQPTLIRHIETLEQALGFRLFTRSRQGLAPTENARELEPYARSLADTAAALRRAASGTGREIRGSVRISASEMVGAFILPPILTAIRQEYPKIAFELTLSNIQDDLLARRADIAVRMVQPTQQALVSRKLGRVVLGLYAHRHYLKRFGQPSSVEDLARHSLIGFDRETAEIRAMRARIGAVADLPAFALRADSDIAQFMAIKAGFGIGFCQAGLAAGETDLEAVLPAAVRFDLGVWLAMHEDLKQVPRLRAAFDLLGKGLGDYLG